MLQIFMQVLKLEEHFEGLFVGMVFIELWVGGLLMLQRVAALKGCFAIPKGMLRDAAILCETSSPINSEHDHKEFEKIFG
jgi:hypothetical protein